MILARLSSIVATGDHVWILPSLNNEGVIERVEPRHGILTRASRNREHVLVANVDQVVIVMALKEPDLKLHLIDRYLASAEQGGIQPIICLNKADLIDPVEVQSIIGYYSQLGIPTLERVVARYCEKTSRDAIPDLDWYFAFNLFRLLGIAQGIKKRLIDGNASSSRAGELAGRIPQIAAQAWRFAERAGA